MNTLSAIEVRAIIHDLGPTLTALAASCSSRTEPNRWVVYDIKPTKTQMERLIVIKEVMSLVAICEGIEVAKAWFIGANCDNMTTSPAEVIREGRFDEARASAKRMASDSFN